MIKFIVLRKNFVFVAYSYQTHNVSPINDSRAEDLFALIHCDIWGGYTIASSCDAFYFLTIVDDYSKAIWVYLMSPNSEVKQLIQYICAITSEKTLSAT